LHPSNSGWTIETMARPEAALPPAEASLTPPPDQHRLITDDQGELIDVIAASSPFGLWLRRAVIDDFGNEVMPPLLNSKVDPT
jgi:hypothetical protein